ncbi:MAG: DNA polymerase III subunit delta [Chloroflexota bacterium]
MIYLFYGPDSFSIQEAVQRQVRGALPAETADLNTARLAAGEVTLDALRFACEAVPFLADRRAVVVEHLFARLNTRRSRRGRADQTEGKPEGQAEQEKGLATEIAAYLPNVPPNTLLIFVESDAPPKTGALAKALSAAGAKQQFFPVLAGMPLVRWIKERAKAGEVSITDRAAELLAGFVGGDLRTLSHELAKLSSYAGPGRPIDAPDVHLLVSQASEANVFEFVDAIGMGNRPRALSSLHLLLEQGERPERILAMVSRQVRLLLQAKDLTQRGEASEAIGRALGLSPFPLRKIMEQIRLFQLPSLEVMHHHVLAADLQIKTGLQEPTLALELLVTELTGEARVRPARRTETRSRITGR